MPSRGLRLFLGAAVTAGSLAVLARASATPLPVRGAGVSRLRLSWTARPERIEHCRVLSAEELERREEHMRQQVECEGRFATYALTVEVDSIAVHEQVVRGAGLRHDRPLFVLREVDLAPGSHRLRITLAMREQSQGDSTISAPVAPIGSDTGRFAGRAQREGVERTRRARAAIPRSLVLDTTLVFAPSQVRLVSFDADSRSLRVIADSSPVR